MSNLKKNQPLLMVLNSPKLDTSDLILLTTKILEDNLDESPELLEAYSYIQKQYLIQDYDSALIHIAGLYTNYEPQLGTKIVHNVLSKLTVLSNHPQENNSRRFYETTYANTLEALIKEEDDYAIFTKLNDIYNQYKPEYAAEGLPSINNFEEAKELILSFWIFNDTVEIPLKMASKTYHQKDRSRENSGTVFTTNPGIMRPNAPNFFDNQTLIKKIEKINIDSKKTEGYSTQNPQVPFVASFSGTTFSLVVLLSHYIEHYKTQSNLEAEINRIIRLWVCIYIKEGYHSYRELIDVLREPNIQAIFSKAGIQLDYAISNVTKNAFHLAQDYALLINTKTMLHKELPTLILGIFNAKSNEEPEKKAEPSHRVIEKNISKNEITRR